MKLIHITDFHLPSPGESLWGLDPFDRLGRCLDDIARWHGDAAFCVITGDMSDCGDPGAYDWLARRLEAFPLPTFMIPGNHDDREALKAAFPGLPQSEGGFIQFVQETEAGPFIFLDTCKGPVSEGRLCAQRLDWLARALDDARGQDVRLFMHHPPFDVGIPYMDRIKLENPDDFVQMISRHDRIRHIFFGHVHRAAFIEWRGIPCTCLPGTSHQVPLKRESIDGVPYSVEPSMYAVVEISPSRTLVHFDAPLDRAPADVPPRR